MEGREGGVWGRATQSRGEEGGNRICQKGRGERASGEFWGGGGEGENMICEEWGGGGGGGEASERTKSLGEEGGGGERKGKSSAL